MYWGTHLYLGTRGLGASSEITGLMLKILDSMNIRARLGVLSK